jgi:hypothetical protein
VRIDPHEPQTTGVLQREVERRRDVAPGAVQELDPVVDVQEGLDHAEGVVSRPAVDDQDLQVAVLLPAHRVQTLADESVLVERRNHDRDETRLRHLPPSRR